MQKSVFVYLPLSREIMQVDVPVINEKAPQMYEGNYPCISMTDHLWLINVHPFFVIDCSSRVPELVISCTILVLQRNQYQFKETTHTS